VVIISVNIHLYFTTSGRQ